MKYVFSVWRAVITHELDRKGDGMGRVLARVLTHASVLILAVLKLGAIKWQMACLETALKR